MDIFSKKREGCGRVDSDTILSEEDKILVDESFKHEKERTHIQLFYLFLT